MCIFTLWVIHHVTALLEVSLRCLKSRYRLPSFSEWSLTAVEICMWLTLVLLLRDAHISLDYLFSQGWAAASLDYTLWLSEAIRWGGGAGECERKELKKKCKNRSLKQRPWISNKWAPTSSSSTQQNLSWQLQHFCVSAYYGRPSFRQKGRQCHVKLCSCRRGRTWEALWRPFEWSSAGKGMWKGANLGSHSSRDFPTDRSNGTGQKEWTG